MGSVTNATTAPVRFLVVGGGYVGMYTALRLQRKLKRRLRPAAHPGTGRGAEIVVVDPDPYMTYRPFLPEAAAGSLSPRHAVIPLRSVLRQCRIITGEAVALDPRRRVAHIRTLATAEQEARRFAPGRDAPPAVPAQGERCAGGVPAGTLEVPYDELVLAPGSVARTPPVPGLAEHGLGFSSVEEAIGLRNHVLEQLDIASSTRDPGVRDSALTFVFVGGGYAGLQALAEIEDMTRYACRYYHNIRPEEPRFVLVEAAGRVLPEVDEEMSAHVLRELRARNMDVRLGRRVESCGNRVVTLDDGSRHPARTLVWTAGTQPHPVLAASGLPLTGQGRLACTARLTVDGVPHVWSGGDCAAVPDLAAAEASGAAGGGPVPVCAPGAQHAVRQARVLADNLLAGLEGKPLTDYRHAGTGPVVSLGLHKGIAYVRGRKLQGYPAWLLHRAHHLGRVPTVGRKARVLAEWGLSGLFKREIVSLGSLGHPRSGFERVAGSGRCPGAE